MLYLRCMLIFALHTGIYDACWYFRCMLVFALHAGIYDACWYLRCMLVFTMHAGIYNACMLIFALHAGIYDACWYLHCMLVFTMHAGIWLHACLHFRITCISHKIAIAIIIRFAQNLAAINFALSVDLRSYGRYSCAHSLRNSYVIHYGIAKFVPSVMFRMHRKYVPACSANTSMHRKYQHAAQISTCMHCKYQHAS